MSPNIKCSSRFIIYAPSFILLGKLSLFQSLLRDVVESKKVFK